MIRSLPVSRNTIAGFRCRCRCFQLLSLLNYPSSSRFVRHYVRNDEMLAIPTVLVMELLLFRSLVGDWARVLPIHDKVC